jgi:thiol-disulfide isomerase/thioredoxin
MKKTTIVQNSILTAMLLLNSGCFFGYHETPKVKVEKKIAPNTQILKQIIQQPKIMMSNTPSIECTDDINSPNSCHKKPIKAQDLKPKKITIQGGEVHKLRSIQGRAITVVENKNGFIFPQYRNKVVILQMFGKNCSHCIKEIPIMGKLYRKYRKNLEIIAVQVENKMTKREAKRLLQSHQIKYSVVPGDDATNLQYNIQSTYGWTGVLPYTLVIKNGVTEFTYPGEVTYSEINGDILSLIQ